MVYSVKLPAPGCDFPLKRALMCAGIRKRLLNSVRLMILGKSSFCSVEQPPALAGRMAQVSRPTFGAMNGRDRLRGHRSPIRTDGLLVGLCGHWGSEPPRAAMCRSTVDGMVVGLNDRGFRLKSHRPEVKLTAMVVEVRIMAQAVFRFPCPDVFPRMSWRRLPTSLISIGCTRCVWR